MQKWMLNAWCMNGEYFKNGRWTHAKQNYWIQFQEQTQQIANKRKRNGKLMQWKANATEHKMIGTQTQWMQTETQQNGKAMERKSNSMQTFLQRNANADGIHCKWNGNFYNCYCKCWKYIQHLRKVIPRVIELKGDATGYWYWYHCIWIMFVLHIVFECNIHCVEITCVKM